MEPRLTACAVTRPYAASRRNHCLTAQWWALRRWENQRMLSSYKMIL